MLIDVHNHNTKLSPNIQISNICIGIKRTKSEKYSAGIHPWYIENYNLEFFFSYLKLLLKYKEIIAIGETGIDKFANTSIEIQEEIFLKHLLLAEQYNLPVVIHCVKCYDRLLYYRKNFKKIPWIIHNFSGNEILAKQFISLNVFLSLGYNFMRDNSKVAKIFKYIDLNYIFFETDDSTLSIENVYRKAASILNIDIKELENIIYSNFKRVFYDAKS